MLSSLVRSFSSKSSRSPTAVVMLNMGGPETVEDVEFFLSNLFSDPEIIPLGSLQPYLGPLIGRRRTPQIKEQYAAIGGGSPILKWTELQGEAMSKRLDRLSPETAPHKHYVAFRYANPLTGSALQQMKADGVERAVAFSQYPQMSCTTAGSSFNNLWRELKHLNMEKDFQWSVIDRWPTHPSFVAAVADRVKEGLEQFPVEERDEVVLMFTAHGVPMKTVQKGDSYTTEVCASVQSVVDALKLKNPHVLSWQSKVGYLPWMAPSTSETIEGLGKRGVRSVLAIPIAFTSDHVETLFEIDIEYAEEAHEAGIQSFKRAPSMNDSPLFADALAAIVGDHLSSGEVSSRAYRLKCAHCTSEECRQVLNPVQPYLRHGEVESSSS